MKACIAKMTNQHDFPDKDFVHSCYMHSIEKLVGLANLKLQRDADADKNRALKNNWSVAKDWNEGSRYARWTQKEGQDLYDAITDPADGVLPWLKTHW